MSDCDNCSPRHYCKLDELRLLSKKSFELLNTFRFSLQHLIMFTQRQAYKVLRTVIGFDAVKMVHNPSLGQKLPVQFLPNQYMLADVWMLLCCPWMLGGKYIHIPAVYIPSALPTRAILSRKITLLKKLSVVNVGAWTTAKAIVPNRRSAIVAFIRPRIYPRFLHG